jgi:hypothetical protein
MEPIRKVSGQAAETPPGRSSPLRGGEGRESSPRSVRGDACKRTPARTPRAPLSRHLRDPRGTSPEPIRSVSGESGIGIGGAEAPATVERRDRIAARKPRGENRADRAEPSRARVLTGEETMSGRRKISRWGRERDSKRAPLDGHARVLQREASRAHSRHGRRSVALGDGALEPNDERELLVTRDDRHERALGEVPVSDLAAVRRPDPPGLPHARGREEVVQVKAPILVITDAIRALRVNLPAQRRRRDRLRLAAREQRATVRAREETTFRGDRTDRVNVAPVLSTPVPADHVADRARLHAPARQTNIRRLRGSKRGRRVSR